MTPGLQILFEDEHCLGVLKPAGQLTQGTWAPPGETTLEQDVRRHLAPESPETAYLGIVHRLDRPVSGVLLWAKTSKAARRLAGQFEKRQAVKEYWAVVEASDATDVQAEPSTALLPPLGELWVDWLTSADKSGVVHSVAEGTLGARRAQTRVMIDASAGMAAGLRRLRLWPETGRTHQLRVQSATRGLPILGDSLYGARETFSPGIALHARSLQVRHPMSAVPLILVAALPESWRGRGIDPGPAST
ncbi:RluA family pseudouridine synthase [Planctomyces sp. SH-PL62]|uniref:RluA family pseudouridine synthase n=1 Tax=Planctomyces sp. SH-PL62 TaxID=1636152 RepID=UPI00078D134A|nr:RluA family pseudouridine synthase [Planctomyces sp. SH-PL62]AMV39003.1 tRNA pseudouridine synthase C [Planctomyces sp. SH-PL62]